MNLHDLFHTFLLMSDHVIPLFHALGHLLQFGLKFDDGIAQRLGIGLCDPVLSLERTDAIVARIALPSTTSVGEAGIDGREDPTEQEGPQNHQNLLLRDFDKHSLMIMLFCKR